MSLLIKKILTKLKDIDVRTTTGQEVKTNEIIDGKRVYKKRINCGNLPNATSKYVNTRINRYNFCKSGRKRFSRKWNYSITICKLNREL